MTREEALKIVRENYPHFGTTEPWLDLEKALATLIPELRESEDERIRRNLVEAFIEYKKSGGTDFHGIEIDYLLAWLEKQKEDLTPEEKMNHPLYLEGFDVGREVGKVEAEQKPALGLKPGDKVKLIIVKEQ